MYNRYRLAMHSKYNQSRDYFIKNPQCLIDIEKWATKLVNNSITTHKVEIVRDYNEASYLNPFWQNYPPEDRGRSPVGDQIPWIEVGEHTVGHKLSRLISLNTSIFEVGLPSGADNRFIVKDKNILKMTKNYTDTAMVFLDIKSVGPRDDAENTVLSPYQVSGDGLWTNIASGIENSKMIAKGPRAQHPFYPAIPPIYILSDGTIAPVIHLFVKPVYKMLSLQIPPATGQPLNKIRIITLPNGLLLTQNPNYIKTYPSLIFPGKDEKEKPPKKMRCRISFDILTKIAKWRVINIQM